MAAVRPCDDALEMLAQAHRGQRATLDALDAVARADAPDLVRCAALATTLVADLRLHLRDEEDGLFPLLRRRAQPDDALPETLARLSQEHRALERAARAARAALTALAEAPSDLDRATVIAYAEAKRRHVMFEAAVVATLARARLTAADCAALARRLRALSGPV